MPARNSDAADPPSLHLSAPLETARLTSGVWKWQSRYGLHWQVLARLAVES